MKDVLSHLFLPRESNNHRAKALHHKNIISFIVVFIVFQLFFNTLKTSDPSVLGTSTDISAQKLLEFTNKERLGNNLLPLSLSSQLSQAADNKAKDMFLENYWAHFSPSGTTPWSFIKASGYDYVYAGENLARGFTDASSVVTAWMNSPTHRENQLSPNYTDVGYAIEEGKLTGQNTTLVVEMFGSTPDSLAKARNMQDRETVVSKAKPNENSSNSSSLLGQASQRPLINSQISAKMIVFILLLIFIFMFVLDFVIVYKRGIARIIGNHLDHAIFFILLVIFVILHSNGVIL